MGLARQLAWNFSDAVRSRGTRYYEAGNVSIRSGSELGVRAVVQGSENYRVGLRFEGDQALKVRCTCPYFVEEGGPCKHLWAVILAAEERRLLGAMAGQRGGVVLEYADPEEGENEDDPSDDGDQDGEGDEGEEEIEEVEPDLGRLVFGGGSRHRLGGRPGEARNSSDNWRSALQSLRATSLPHTGIKEIRVSFILDKSSSEKQGRPALQVWCATRGTGASWSEPRSANIAEESLEKISDVGERNLLIRIVGAAPEARAFQAGLHLFPSDYFLAPLQTQEWLPVACASGRAFLRRGPSAPLQNLAWDPGEAWQLRFELALPESQAQGCILRGELERGAEKLNLQEADLVVEGLLVQAGLAARLQGWDARWMDLLRRGKDFRVPLEDVPEFLESLSQMSDLAPLKIPESCRLESTRLPPQKHVVITAPESKAPRLPTFRGQKLKGPLLKGQVFFRYGEKRVAAGDARLRLADGSQRLLIERDLTAEKTALAELMAQEYVLSPDLVFNPSDYGHFELPADLLTRAARDLMTLGWEVEAEGRLFRHAKDIRIAVVSGIDWFDLSGAADFDGLTASLPDLLQALKSQDGFVRLGDGTFGLLPEEWMKRFAILREIGDVEGDGLRFSRPQAFLLDSLLAGRAEVDFDANYRHWRAELDSFAGIGATPVPEGFQGKLRAYQQAGLGWLEYLSRFGFGGILADDMGLGKTIQVLALFQKEKENRKGDGQLPALVVVPRSLLFNWRDEAARFTPSLKVHTHSGLERQAPGAHFGAHDIVLTTYGTLLRDAEDFAKVEFSLAVLDEATVVKNAASKTAKAVRLLRARRRLALSGTPVENHLGELWSIFEFLNPGLLGRVSAFKDLLKLRDGAPGTEDARLLVSAVRPFILRRTKAEVAKDLPERSEQTLHCEMDKEQRRLYDELLRHYQAALLRAGAPAPRNKIHVLEALLRLRQAACHPGLIDPGRAGEDSAKLETLSASLAEILEGGHRALVFSQFTRFLAIVRRRLEQDGLPCLYLDGRTRDRKEKVAEFQKGAHPVFLISLKAGGLGLNLTAADYVFLLDPWWNPATEAQAIDRAHRIGQERNVFAYRLICKDTVEERVLELQARKRNLAALVTSAGEEGFIESLRREDLEFLFS